MTPHPSSLIPHPSHKGFTLVELLVVIGIIVILAGILLSVTGGGTESARAAKCMSNLRSLANGANAAAMSGRWYPFAGSCQYAEIGSGRDGLIYKEQVGWISWLSNKGDPFGHEPGGKAPTAPVNVSVCEYNTDNEYDVTFALTNGAIWKAVNCNKSIYTCPTHTIWCQQHIGGTPNWSYVMNAKFGYDYSKGSKGVPVLAIRREYAKLARADRVLMFAELPLGEESGADKWSRDCTLQYKASVNGNTYGKNWNGTPESIGFVHKGNKGRYCGHVAFADGHTEKILEPRGGGLDAKELTALLCEGKDVSFGANGYQEIRETD